jgi:hypothetical protein
MIGLKRLAEPMSGDNCRAELFSERYREPLKAACAEDREIWAIYANNFGPDGFDGSIARYTSNPNNRTFVLFEGNELAGMSSYLGIDRTGRCWRSAGPTIGAGSAEPGSTDGSRR